MNSKERFLAACEHRESDRIPIDYHVHPELDKRLRGYYGVETEDELLDRLECDFYYLSGRDISQNEGFISFYNGSKLTLTETERVCPFGIRWKRGAYNSKFFVDEMICGPLEKVTSPQEILNHKWPEPADFDFSPLEAECEAHADRVIVGGLWSGIFGDSYRMHGYQNFLMNILLAPELIKTLINRMTEVYLKLNDVIFSLLRERLDIWFFGNDFGTQKGLMFSKEMLADFFIEHIKSLTDLAHSYGLKVMMHSCGSIADIIPLLIESGVDILNPIQVSAKNMRIDNLKKQFGNQLVFHGGIDTQHVLPEGSTEEVRQHVTETIRVFGKKGGYIFAPSQNLGPDIPVENVITMYKTANEYHS